MNSTEQFISALAGNIAWPLTVGGVALLFQGAIRGAIGRISEVRKGDTSIKLAAQTAELREEADGAASDLPEAEPDAPIHERLEQLKWLRSIAVLAPDGAILDAHNVLAEALLDVGRPFGFAPRLASPSYLAIGLRATGALTITDHELELFGEATKVAREVQDRTAKAVTQATGLAYVDSIRALVLLVAGRSGPPNPELADSPAVG